MIVTMFPEPREQAKAIGVYGFVASAGGSIGLLAGGVLTQAISWHWIFFINLPIGIATAFFALTAGRGQPRHRPQGRRRHARRGPDHRLADDRHLRDPRRHRARLGLGADPDPQRRLVRVLVAAFVARQARIENPLMPLRPLPLRATSSGANVIQALLVAGMFGMFFLGALYLQRILDYDALEVGLAFLPTTVVMGTISLGFSEKLIMRFGPRHDADPGRRDRRRRPAALRPHAGRRQLPDRPAAAAAAGRLRRRHLLPLADDAGDVGRDPEDAGLASGVVNTSMQVGGAIGLAVLATLAAERTDGPRSGRRRRNWRRSTPATTSPTWSARRWSPSRCCVAVIVLRQPRPRRRTGRRGRGRVGRGAEARAGPPGRRRYGRCSCEAQSQAVRSR